MYKVFNMGHRMELYVSENIANQIVDISKSFGVEAKIIGRVESSKEKTNYLISKWDLHISIMIEKLKDINNRYLEVEKLISSPDAMNDMKSYIQLSKEYKDLEPIIKAYKEYAGLIDNIEEAKDIISNSDDIEMKEMARSELDISLNRKVVMDDEIKLLLIPKILQMKKMLLWKLELEQVVMKQVFLLEIYLECILLMQLLKDGKLKLLILLKGQLVAIKKSFQCFRRGCIWTVKV